MKRAAILAALIAAATPALAQKSADDIIGEVLRDNRPPRDVDISTMTFAKSELKAWGIDCEPLGTTAEPRGRDFAIVTVVCKGGDTYRMGVRETYLRFVVRVNLLTGAGEEVPFRGSDAQQ